MKRIIWGADPVLWIFKILQQNRKIMIFTENITHKIDSQMIVGYPGHVYTAGNVSLACLSCSVHSLACLVSC